jgi:chaperonin GroES
MAKIGQPIGGKLLVEPLEEEKTVGGIIIPDTAKEKSQRGKIVAIGKIDEENPELKEGDTVIFDKYAGTEIEFDGKKYLILNKEDILLKIN